MDNKVDKFKETYETLANGNHSDFNKIVKEMDKVELVMFIGYLLDNKYLGVLEYTVINRILKALYSN